MPAACRFVETYGCTDVSSASAAETYGCSAVRKSKASSRVLSCVRGMLAAMAVDEWMLEWMQQSQSPLSVLASAMGEAWAGVRRGLRSLAHAS